MRNSNRKCKRNRKHVATPAHLVPFVVRELCCCCCPFLRGLRAWKGSDFLFRLPDRLGGSSGRLSPALSYMCVCGCMWVSTCVAHADNFHTYTHTHTYASIHMRVHVSVGVRMGVGASVSAEHECECECECECV